MLESNYEVRIKTLTDNFNEALNSKLLNFEESKELKSCGIYIVYNEEEEIIYIGKTGRDGKTRLRELASDYRSHTFNKKLLKEKLDSFLETNGLRLTNKTKEQLIVGETISRQGFSDLQKEVNEVIKKRYKFRFYEVEASKLTETEHFFIAVVNPRFND
jgi:GIY-YIG catalytic domain